VMAIVDITVPNWGLDMEEATVVMWLKHVGDQIVEGEAILALETDKAEGDVEAEVSGRLVEVVAEQGQIVVIGDLLGRIDTGA
jgi:pyruvate/2-oxoglutarate dehydrogenase complex dihydrolipoamide acyltransferase (E2) component